MLIWYEVIFFKIESNSADLTWSSHFIVHVKLGPSIFGDFFDFIITCTGLNVYIDASLFRRAYQKYSGIASRDQIEALSSQDPCDGDS